MKTINLLIKENSDTPICCIQNKKETNYIVFKTIVEEIYKLCLKYNQISVTETNISVSNGLVTLNIKDYKNNNNQELEPVIKRLRKDYKELKKQKLRKQKIKRISALSCAILISGGVIANILSNENIIKDSQAYEDIKSDSNITKLSKKEEEPKVKFIVDEETNKKNELNNENIKDYNKNIVVSNELEINFESRTDSAKFQTTNSYYNEIITKISNEYGIDPRIMLAIATQECGIHNPDLKGPAIGLMQIERSVWDGHSISAYNYDKCTNETLNITEIKLKNLEFNIRVACMHFQKCLIDSKYILPVAIQMYNFGYGNIQNTFRLYFNNNNISLNEALSDYDSGWLEYREKIKVGDNKYLEHILSYIEDLDNIRIKKGNEIINYSIKNKVKTL